MPSTILRFEKQTGGAAGRLEAHHEWEKKNNASNPDIDRSRSKDNYHLITPKSRYSLEINRRIQAMILGVGMKEYFTQTRSL